MLDLDVPKIDLELVAEVFRIVGSDPIPLPRHRHGIKRDAVKRAQRARILVATADEVAELGYAASSVASIGKRAGVSSRTFYECYADKEAAFLGLYEVLDAWVVSFAVAVFESDTPSAMLHAAVHSYVQVLSAAPSLARVLVVDALGGSTPIQRRRVEALQSIVEALSRGLARGGVFGPSVPQVDDQMLMAVVGAVNELVYQHLLYQDASTIEVLEPVIQRLVARVLLP